jgi:hypothetical protein
MAIIFLFRRRNLEDRSSNVAKGLSISPLATVHEGWPGSMPRLSFKRMLQRRHTAADTPHSLFLPVEDLSLVTFSVRIFLVRTLLC